MYGNSGNQLYRINFGRMKSNKYLDKVIISLVRSTKIDYGKGEVYTPFSLPLMYLHSLVFSEPPQCLYFHGYCSKYFGLTEDEIGYVWKEYMEIINHKIENEK